MVKSPQQTKPVRQPTKHASPVLLSSNPVQSAVALRNIYEVLLESYGPRAWWPARTPLEVIIGAYLVQNTSWQGVVRSSANLDDHGMLQLPALRAVSMEELQTLIRPSGYMIRKSAALKAFIAFLDEHYRGSLAILARQPTDRLRNQLLALPGVGPETADAILLYALGHPVMVVDEYLRRIAVRHRIAPEKVSYTTMQQLAISAFADDPPESLLQHFNEFHALIVEAGKNHCGPTPRCLGCPLAPLLPTP
jgi:endonuclease-3 related protein